MTKYGDYVSIAATTAGVTGTITVPDGALLADLTVNFKGDGGIISSIELTAPNLPTPLKFVPPIGNSTTATNTIGVAVGKDLIIPLGIQVRGTNTITLKVTTTANETVICGLTWLGA